MLALTRRVQPQPTEVARTRLHLATVRTRLKTSFESRILPIGSHSRGTAIRWHSDVDALVVMSRDQARWGGRQVSSRTVLGRVREDLQDRFKFTDIRGDQQAVVVGFASGEQSLDVVPGVFSSFNNGRPIFAIPDGAGDWMPTSPMAHNKYFSDATTRSIGKLPKVVQLLKWWKYARAQPIPIQSFHLDMLLAASDICVGVKPYTHCLYFAFKLLWERECAAFRDPLGIAGLIPAAKTQAQRDALVNAVGYALEHAQAAVAAEAMKDFFEANRQWEIVFHGQY